MIRTYTIAVTTTGNAGVATGSAGLPAGTPPINGFFLGAYLHYSASTPATADVTISFGDKIGTTLTVTNSTTDGWYAVRVQAKDNAGAAITGVYEMYPLDCSTCTVSVAQGDAVTNAVIAHIYVLEA